MNYNVHPQVRAGTGNSESVGYRDTVGALVSFLAQRAPDEPDWSQALCMEVDPELWFSVRGSDNERMAKEICTRCPIMEECKAYALARPELEGIWGGTTETWRMKLRAGQRSADIVSLSAPGGIPSENVAGDVRHVA